MTSLGHSCIFQRVLRLGGVTAPHSSSGRQRNIAALNRGRHLCSAGRPSRWALAHILVVDVFHVFIVLLVCQRHEGGPSMMCFYCLLVMKTPADFIKHVEVRVTFAANDILVGTGFGKPV